jgi:hypothetical protein
MGSVEKDLKRSGVNNWEIKVANVMDLSSYVGSVMAGMRL